MEKKLISFVPATTLNFKILLATPLEQTLSIFFKECIQQAHSCSEKNKKSKK